MNRRHFIQLSSASLTSILVTTYIKAAGTTSTILQMPDTVNILSGDDYVPLQSSDKQNWTYKDVVVQLKQAGEAISVFVQSPTLPLKEVKLQWQYAIPKAATILGDAWERTYGNISWQQVAATQKLPWYCVVHDDKNTICFGVKTGCNAICYWRVDDSNLSLNLNVRNGGSGVTLGSRQLHATDIVTTKNEANENVFATVHRFCKQMCDKPRTVAQPVYGINDWYFAYGNNSAALILQHTSLLAPLATNTNNRPFSVVDDGWATGTDYTKPNAKFGDMQKLTGEIKKLGMRPGLWTRPLLARPGEKKNLLAPTL